MSALTTATLTAITHIQVDALLLVLQRFFLLPISNDRSALLARTKGEKNKRLLVETWEEETWEEGRRIFARRTSANSAVERPRPPQPRRAPSPPHLLHFCLWWLFTDSLPTRSTHSLSLPPTAFEDVGQTKRFRPRLAVSLARVSPCLYQTITRFYGK